MGITDELVPTTWIDEEQRDRERLDALTSRLTGRRTMTCVARREETHRVRETTRELAGVRPPPPRHNKSVPTSKLLERERRASMIAAAAAVKSWEPPKGGVKGPLIWGCVK